jgi:hypothetical protein
MATSEILAFASTDTGTNLLTQAEYSADAQRTTGNQPGIARSKLVNKAMRQSTLISAGVAKFIADYQGNNVTDSLTTQQVADYLLAAIKVQIPTGVITMWSGAIGSIPAGWFLCNGANGTPDLRDRFVIGAGNGYGVGVTGGSKDAIAVAHTHAFSGTTSADGTHTHGVTDPTHSHSGVLPAYPKYTGYGVRTEEDTFDASPLVGSTDPAYTGISINAVGNHQHGYSGTTASTGASGTNANLPPYYALAYIMKG